MADVSVSQFTQNMQSMLPRWMKMAKDPNSIGAQFLDVFGLEFEQVQKYLDSAIGNQYINTASIGQIDVTYKVPLALPIVLDMVTLDTVVVNATVTMPDGTTEQESLPCQVCTTLREFYDDDSTEMYEHKAILDTVDGLVYIRLSEMGTVLTRDNIFAPFDTVDINGTRHYEFFLHHIWNAFDEFALLLGAERLFGERNVDFKERILDVFRKPANSTKQGMLNGISRDLGLDITEVTMNEFANKAFRGSLLDEKTGTPTDKLLRYVNRINKVFGFTWDNMTWGDAYWHSIEEANLGLEYLPHVWDASTTGWLTTDFQSGVGDGDELLVTAPTDQSNIRNFQYKVGVRGKNSGLERVDPEINFKYKITASGIILNEEYKPEIYKYTVAASEIVYLYYTIRAIKDYNFTTAIDFNPTKIGYQYDNDNDPSIEIVKGTTNLSKTDATDWNRYKVIVDMTTNSVKDTPQLKDITIKWKDTSGVTHNYKLDTQNDLTLNDPTNSPSAIVDTEFLDTFATTTGEIELGFGDYYDMIDTYGSFVEGTRAGTVEILNTGSVRLNLPNE
jgi:hypothetical protein